MPKVDFLTSFLSVAVMVFLAVPGFILRKAKMLPEKAVSVLVVVLIYVAQPFLTVSSLLAKDYKPDLLVGMGVSLAFSFVFHALAFLLVRVVFLSFRRKKAAPAAEVAGKAEPADPAVTAETDPNRTDGAGSGESKRKYTSLEARKVCTICSFMGNVGFMGIPVMKALFPNNPEMLLYTAMYNIGFNIASFTLGIFTITGNRKDMSLRRALLNPPTVALAAGLPLFFLKSYIPASVLTPVSSAIGYLADMTLPLSMIILGVRLAELKPKTLFTDPKVYLTCLMKLAVVPLLSLGVALLVRMIFPALDSILIVTGYIIMAMPSASITLAFSEMFDGDRETAVKNLLLTTIMSVITIPLLMLLCPFI